MLLPVVLLAQTLSATSAAPATPPAPTPVAPSAAPAEEKPLDVSEPPFSGDFAWMNGSNPQPASLLAMGPITWSLYVDMYYAWQTARPLDHTIFPTTTAPRHDEISLNLAHIGVDVGGLDGPTGRLYIQYGSTVETIAGQDTTTTRGFFLTNRLLQYVQQAAAGWHFHELHGINVEVGIFPSYVGLESYLPEENWAYTHAFLADATPYYFFGVRGQIYYTDRQKIELWLVNGWQTFGQWHEGRAGGYMWNWRPTDAVSFVNSFYVGQEAEGDPKSLRAYTDNNIQLRYYHDQGSHILKSLAFSLVGDVGHEQRGNAPSGMMGGVALAHRWEWTDRWKTTLRGDFLYDRSQAISPKFPVGSPYTLAGTDPFLGIGGTATIDFWPSPWLVTRLEGSHRWANQPLFSGSGGITGPGGKLPQDAAATASFQPDLRRTDNRIVLNVTLRL